MAACPRCRLSGRRATGKSTWAAAAFSKHFRTLDRGGVLESFKLIDDSDSALDAYIASYHWGYAGTGFGPYRPARVIRLNTDVENGKDFSGELHKLARIAMTNGGNAAFEHVVEQRQSNKKFAAWWGPAFATKFNSFASKASGR